MIGDEIDPPPAPRRQADPAAYVVQGTFCRPCNRRVLVSEARSCSHDCAAKRLAGG